MTNIYLIRHAESEANIKHIYGTDPNLSEKGRRQAEEYAKKIKIKPHLVLAGTKARQIQTAKILFPKEFKGDTNYIFDEIYFGDLENTEIKKEINKSIVDNPLIIHDKHNGDDIWERAEKTKDFIESLGITNPDKTIAIITSDTLMQSIITLLLRGEINGVIWSGEYRVENCSYWWFGLNNKGQIIDMYNQKLIEKRIPYLSMYKQD